MKVSPIGPGEANSRRRKRRQLIYFSVALVSGGIIGGALALLEEGEGNFMSRDFAGLSLDPPVALAIGAMWLASILGLTLWGFRQIDELLIRQNMIGYTGGCLAVLTGYPLWVLLYAGGMAELPHAFGVFMLGVISMTASFAYAKIRDVIPS